MTTIVAFKNTLYADTRCSASGMIISDNVTKLLKVTPKGWSFPVVVGGAGGYEDLERFKVWVTEGLKVDEKPDLEDFQGIMIARVSKSKCQIYYFEDGLVPMLTNDTYLVIGSGSAHALTALDMGHTPQQAIKASMKRDCFTGGKVKALSV